jgi:hypothetical protein
MSGWMAPQLNAAGMIHMPRRSVEALTTSRSSSVLSCRRATRRDSSNDRSRVSAQAPSY